MVSQGIYIEGDGTLLGATLVLGSGEQGIVFQYQATELVIMLHFMI